MRCIRHPQRSTPLLSTGDFIAVDEEEADPEEREFEPKPKPDLPPSDFAHGSTGAGYKAGVESWGMPHGAVLEGSPSQ
jgi:hypothetical protein